jgi:hypothetical protein
VSLDILRELRGCQLKNLLPIERFYKLSYFVGCMSVELTLYEKPELVTGVRPGQILEALPGAEATQAIFLQDPIQHSPTNVFGYVRGVLRTSHRLYGDQGTTLVERLVPFGELYMSEKIHTNGRLSAWCPEDSAVYFAIGELADMQQSVYEEKFPIDFMGESVTLSPEQIDTARDQLLRFMGERGQKDYVFLSPGGSEYSLKEIVFSLQEKE